MGWLSRFLAAVAFFAAGVLFSPETLGSNSVTHLSAYLKLAHLLCFSTAFGTALWVTFIGGIIMFKNLPRHQFGNLQSKMFPAYFSLVGICCAISVAAFAYLHPWKSASTAEKYQLGFLISSFAFSLTNFFVFTPMTIEVMKQRHKVEREENIGTEIGRSKNKEVAKANPKLAAMNKKFGMIHALSSLANIMSFGGLAMHSWYLAALEVSVSWKWTYMAAISSRKFHVALLVYYSCRSWE
ncbi:hypothetical protein DKX38_003299 [Salix brachista]|uniref:TMEM205-like domain-containing protein n=1 Tax=Salix brachista TaxID=2182728 RepID=A0A5N5NSS8_9ROSI|nr:hypothetical protein DKX38_003299 [Salix brachista]